MAEQNAFEKIHIDESEKSNLEGLLEQLNLPPKAITFIRENIRLIQLTTAVIIIGVVTWALYGSYRDNKIEDSSSALAVAMETEGDARIDELNNVVKDFDGTTAALWAKINAAHEIAKSGKVEEAISLYKEAREKCGKDSSLQPLLANSLGQLYEKNEKYTIALTEYEYLKTIKGYEGIGYFGLGRTHELLLEKEKALSVYEEYLGMLNDGNERGEKLLVEEKIVRVKASL